MPVSKGNKHSIAMKAHWARKRAAQAADSGGIGGSGSYQAVTQDLRVLPRQAFNDITQDALDRVNTRKVRMALTVLVSYLELQPIMGDTLLADLVKHGRNVLNE